MITLQTTQMPLIAPKPNPLQPVFYDPDLGGVQPWLGQIHCGDCIALMDQMPAGSVNLIVTSPPYNLLNSTGNGMKDGRGSKWPKTKLRHGYGMYDDNMDRDEYVAWQRGCLTSMMRLLRNDGAIFYNHKERVQGGKRESSEDIVASFPVRQTIIWEDRKSVV